jgi:hypothetical protein
MSGHTLRYDGEHGHHEFRYEQRDSHLVFAVLLGYANGRYHEHVTFTWRDEYGEPCMVEVGEIHPDVARSFLTQMEYVGYRPLTLGRMK